MMFNNIDTYFESEKERNLYYKIFGAYICNKFVKGYAKRIQVLSQILSKPKPLHRDAKQIDLDIQLDLNDMQVSFDNYLHRYRFPKVKKEKKVDRGEFADILIQCKSTRTLICIEAKLHSDWRYDKDIEENQDRQHRIRDMMNDNIKVVPYLLVTTAKWQAVQELVGHKKSNYNRLLEDLPGSEYQCNLILWEDLMRCISHQEVKDYLTRQLEISSKNKYNFNGDWFERESKKNIN